MPTAPAQWDESTAVPVSGQSQQWDESTAVPLRPAAPAPQVAPPQQKNSPSYDVGPLTGKPVRGMIQNGNIDVNHRPGIANADGTHSSIYSITVPLDKSGRAVPWESPSIANYALVPGIADGKFLTPDGKEPPQGNKTAQEAIEQAATDRYNKTREHLGIFASDAEANQYATATHAWMNDGTDRKVFTPSYGPQPAAAPAPQPVSAQPPAPRQPDTIGPAPEPGRIERARQWLVNSNPGQMLERNAPGVASALGLTPTESDAARQERHATDTFPYHPIQAAEQINKGMRVNQGYADAYDKLAGEHPDWDEDAVRRVLADRGITPATISERAGGAHKVVSGLMEEAKPLMLVGAAAAPLRAAVGLGLGLAGQRVGEKTATALGATPNEAALTGDVAGLGGAILGSQVHGDFGDVTARVPDPVTGDVRDVPVKTAAVGGPGFGAAVGRDESGQVYAGGRVGPYSKNWRSGGGVAAPNVQTPAEPLALPAPPGPIIEGEGVPIPAQAPRAAAAPPPRAPAVRPPRAPNLAQAEAALRGRPIEEIQRAGQPAQAPVVPPPPSTIQPAPESPQGASATPQTPVPAPAAPAAPQPQSGGQRPAVQASGEPAELRKSAQEQKPDLEAMAGQVAAAVPGTDVVGPRVKKIDSMENKAGRVDENGVAKTPETIEDPLGVRLVAPKPAAVSAVEQAVREKMPVVSTDKIDSNGLDVTQFGVAGRPGEPMQTMEVQVVKGPAQAAAMKASDADYARQKEVQAEADNAKDGSWRQKAAQKEADEIGEKIKAAMDKAKAEDAKAAAKKPVTPQVPAMPGTAPLGAQPVGLEHPLRKGETVVLPDGRKATALHHNPNYSQGGRVTVQPEGSKSPETFKGDQLKRAEAQNAPGPVGAPLPARVAQIKAYAATGKPVKIFTARGDDPQVKAWVQQQGLGNVPVTNIKSHDFGGLIDNEVNVPTNSDKPFQIPTVPEGKTLYVDLDGTLAKQPMEGQPNEQRISAEQPAGAVANIPKEEKANASEVGKPAEMAVHPERQEGAGSSGREGVAGQQQGTQPAGEKPGRETDAAKEVKNGAGHKITTRTEMLDELSKPDTYIRWQNGIPKPGRGSLNHGNMSAEGGLSVNGPGEDGEYVAEYAGFGGDRAFVVRGERVGTGGDGEPLIDKDNFRVIAEISPKLRDRLSAEKFLWNAERDIWRRRSDAPVTYPTWESSLKAEIRQKGYNPYEKSRQMGLDVPLFPDKRVLPQLSELNKSEAAKEPTKPGREADRKEEVEPKFKHGNTQADIPPGSDAGKALARMRKAILPEDLAGEGMVNDSHITVRYGIDGGDTAGIRAYLEKQAPFEAALGKTQAFPPSEHSDGAAPIVAPVESTDLRRMEKEIDKHGNFVERSFPEYKPHATLAYVKPEEAHRYTGMTETGGQKFTVKSISITDRNGNSEEVQLKGISKPQFSAAARAKEEPQPKPAEIVQPVKLKNYSWDAVKLSNAYDLPELEQLRQQLITDPANQNRQNRANGGDSIYLYTPETHKKLDNLARAVQFVLNDKKAAREVAQSPTGNAQPVEKAPVDWNNSESVVKAAVDTSTWGKQEPNQWDYQRRINPVVKAFEKANRPESKPDKPQFSAGARAKAKKAEEVPAISDEARQAIQSAKEQYGKVTDNDSTGAHGLHEPGGRPIQKGDESGGKETESRTELASLSDRERREAAKLPIETNAALARAYNATEDAGSPYLTLNAHAHAILRNELKLGYDDWDGITLGPARAVELSQDIRALAHDSDRLTIRRALNTLADQIRDAAKQGAVVLFAGEPDYLTANEENFHAWQIDSGVHDSDVIRKAISDLPAASRVAEALRRAGYPKQEASDVAEMTAKAATGQLAKMPGVTHADRLEIFRMYTDAVAQHFGLDVLDNMPRPSELAKDVFKETRDKYAKQNGGDGSKTEKEMGRPNGRDIDNPGGRSGPDRGGLQATSTRAELAKLSKPGEVAKEDNEKAVSENRSGASSPDGRGSGVREGSESGSEGSTSLTQRTKKGSGTAAGASDRAGVGKTSDLGTKFYSNPFFDPGLYKQFIGDPIKEWASDKETTGDTQKALMRETRGQRDRREAIAAHKLSKELRDWDRRSRADSLAFMNAVEHVGGKTIDDLAPKDRDLAELLSAMGDHLKAKIEALQPDVIRHWIENYYAHLWEKPSQARSVIQAMYASKRPFAGRASFLRQRTVPNMQDGIDMGLKPATWNPVRNALLKFHEMNQFIMGHETLQVMKDSGTAKYVRAGSKSPDGWVRLDDRIGTVYGREKIVNENKLDAATYDKTYMGGNQPIPSVARADVDEAMNDATIIRGYYYAPADAAKAFNNYMSTGLAGRFGVYDALRWANNNLNIMQLAISGFHATMTTFAAASGDTGLAIQQATEGKPIEAGVSLFRGVTALPSLINTLRNGIKLHREYVDPGTYAEMSRQADAIARAGGRFAANTVEIRPLDKAVNALRNGAVLEGLSAVPGTLLHAITDPLMKFYVPMMKFGAFCNMSSNVLENAEQGNWSPEQTRVRVQEAWKSVDNRFGELVRDNLFWHKALLDVLDLTTRSVGYTYGTINEYAGAAYDTAKQAGKAASGEKPRVTDRMAFAIASFINAGILGGALTYLMTGQRPRGWKDYYFPKKANGSRLSMPVYPTQIINMMFHPVSTMTNKISPILGAFTQALQNRDFYGTEIRHPDDSTVKQLWEFSKWAARQPVPFAAESAERQLKQRGAGPSLAEILHSARQHPGDVVAGFFGFNPAPAYIEHSTAYNLAQKYSLENRPPGTKTAEDTARYDAKQAIRTMQRTGDVDQDQIDRYVQQGVLKDEDVDKVMREADEVPIVHAAKSLHVDQYLNVYQKATPEEREALEDHTDKIVERERREQIEDGIDAIKKDEAEKAAPSISTGGGG